MSTSTPGITESSQQMGTPQNCLCGGSGKKMQMRIRSRDQSYENQEHGVMFSDVGSLKFQFTCADNQHFYCSRYSFRKIMTSKHNSRILEGQMNAKNIIFRLYFAGEKKVFLKDERTYTYINQLCSIFVLGKKSRHFSSAEVCLFCVLSLF